VHELSVASAVLETVERHAEGRRVVLVGLRVGRLRQVVPESLEFYWGIVTKGTEYEHAQLRLDEVEARLACSDCGERWEPDLPVFRCAGCGSAHVEISAGEELSVEYIEVENTPAGAADGEEAACTALG
jgi:hydrogenase nickel incorporation protein HypA/HybF